jgi:hypothetical protein
VVACPSAVCRPGSHEQERDEVGSGSQKNESTNKKPKGNELTFNLLLLHFEGPARLLSLALQLEVQGLLLLEGLALVLVRDAELHQLPVEARHLLLLLLEHGPHLLERGALLLELAQRFLARHPLLLERGPGLDERRPLSLKLAFRLLACGSLLPELLLRCGERGGLVHQGCLQPLRLLKCRTALLELGAGSGDLHLPCRREGAHVLQVFMSPAQHVVPLDQHRPHPHDRGGAYRGLGALLRGRVQQGLGPVRQPPVRRPERLDKVLQGFVLPPVPAELGVEAVEGDIPLPGPALQLLPPTSRAREAGIRKEPNEGKAGGRIAKLHGIQLTWKVRHARPPWIHNASFSARLSEAPWSRSSSQSHCSA